MMVMQTNHKMPCNQAGRRKVSRFKFKPKIVLNKTLFQTAEFQNWTTSSQILQTSTLSTPLT